MKNESETDSLFLDLISEYARIQPNHTACIFQTRGIETAVELTYIELYQSINKRAKLLISLGYQSKSVALLYPTGMDFVINFLACFLAGVVAVPLNVSRNIQQFERTIGIMEDAHVKAVLTTENTKILLSEQLADLPLEGRESLNWLTEVDDIESSNFDLKLPKLYPDNIAFVQYTSGSTSAPKGVIVSHGNIIDNMEAIKVACNNEKRLIAGGWLPQFHDMGLIGHMLHPLYMAGTYVFMPPMNFIQRPSRWLRIISHYRISCSASPNFGYEHCVNLIRDKEDLANIDLSCWKVALNGSEPVRAETMKAFSEKFSRYGFDSNAFLPTYGMAETTLLVSGGPTNTGVSTISLDKNNFTKGLITEAANGASQISIVNCGEVSQHFDIKIVNPDTRIECTQDQIGEIWLSGKSVAKGYLNHPEKTNSDVKAKLVLDDGRRYLRTGDMGFLRSQMLYITGRIKELLIIRGRNLYPYDIEGTCNNYEHASGGNGASVFTYQQDDITKLAAIVEIKKQILAKANLQDLIEDLKALVAERHEISIDKLLIVKPGTIPKTTSGKVKRRACVELI